MTHYAWSIHDVHDIVVSSRRVQTAASYCGLDSHDCFQSLWFTHEWQDFPVEALSLRVAAVCFFTFAVCFSTLTSFKFSNGMGIPFRSVCIIWRTGSGGCAGIFCGGSDSDSSSLLLIRLITSSFIIVPKCKSQCNKHGIFDMVINKNVHSQT